MKRRTLPKIYPSFSPQPSVYSAFSLIELIVAMLVISVLTTVVIIKFTGVDSQSNRLAANELRAHLTYIRNMAMSHERVMRVQFSSNSYEVWEAVSNWTGTYRLAKDPVTQKNWINDIGSKFTGASLTNVNINGSNTLYFSETNGMPFSVVGFARAPLTTNGIITFNSGLRVTVAPETGYADVE